MYDMTRPFSPDERVVLKEVFESFYRRFVASVAAGRKKGFEEIDAVAQGRIWTGAAAVEAGLVDAIGGLPEAMDALRELARVTGETPIKVFPPRASIWDLFGRDEPSVVLSRSPAMDARAPLVWMEETRFFEPFSGLALSWLAVEVR